MMLNSLWMAFWIHILTPPKRKDNAVEIGATPVEK